MPELHRILNSSSVVSLADHIRDGGGHGLDAARHRTCDDIVDVIVRSGLRGRGGAGFPTGRKWRTVSAIGVSVPVVVNAAEGEPGTFKDRALLRRNPYLVLEGALIAARVVNATEVIIAIKGSFTQEIERLAVAIGEVHDAGWSSDIDVRIVEGPGEYLFGEETGLLEVIDGRPPFPRVTPPYRRGIRSGERLRVGRAWAGGSAVLVDNVETLANVPSILRHGPDWYRSVGTSASPGTIICTVTGDTTRHGVGEFPLGTPLREVIETIGGGVAAGQSISVVLSGVSNAPIGPRQIDTPLTYEHMAAIGTGLGSASFIVVDERTPLSAIAAGISRFLAVESCGQCEPCKRDSAAISTAYSSGENNGLDIVDRLSTVARGARCALAGQTERVIGRLRELGAAAPRAGAYVPTAYPIVPLVDLVDGRAVLDLSHLEKRLDWSFPDDGPDSFAWPAQRLADHAVEIRPSHVAESRQLSSTAPASLDSPSDPFASLRQLDAKLERAMVALRSAQPAERALALASLRAELVRHQRATEGIVYPLVGRLAPEVDDEVVWYPSLHEQHAIRLLERLDEHGGLSPRATDALCADLHASIIELERRVLPLLTEALDRDRQRESVVEGDIDLLLG